MPLLNADLGEGYDEVDRKIMYFIDQANVACGGHAGDKDSIARTVDLAMERHVSIGAHPSYVDREYFGRRSLHPPLAELEQQLFDQISLIDDACRRVGTKLSHIKAHGALYNDSNDEFGVMQILLRLAKAFHCDLMIQSLPDNEFSLQEAHRLDIRLVREGFADRGYLPTGRLAPRSRPGAVFHDLEQITEQAKRLADGEAITCFASQERLALEIDSLCVHGDNEIALLAASQLHELFKPNRSC